MLGASRWWDGRLRESAGLLEEALAMRRGASVIGRPGPMRRAALAHTLADLGRAGRASGPDSIGARDADARWRPALSTGSPPRPIGA